MKNILRCFLYWQWLLAYGALLGRQRRSDTRQPAFTDHRSEEPALSADNAKAVVTVTPWKKRKMVLEM